jgi:hypothetical protein
MDRHTRQFIAGELVKVAKDLVAVDRDKTKKLIMFKLLNKAMSSMPGSPEQKKLIKELNTHRKDFGLAPLKVAGSKLLVASGRKELVDDFQIYGSWLRDEQRQLNKNFDAFRRKFMSRAGQIDDTISDRELIRGAKNLREAYKHIAEANELLR